MLQFGDLNFLSDEERENAILHQQKNSFYEQDKIKQQIEDNKSYKQTLIDDILQFSNNFTREILEKKPIRTLERIFDYC